MDEVRLAYMRCNDLMSFLERKGARDKFIRNIQPGRGFSQDFPIDRAFIWDNTPEGHYFWSDLDREFLIYINTAKKEYGWRE